MFCINRSENDCMEGVITGKINFIEEEVMKQQGSLETIKLELIDIKMHDDFLESNLNKLYETGFNNRKLCRLHHFYNYTNYNSKETINKYILFSSK